MVLVLKMFTIAILFFHGLFAFSLNQQEVRSLKRSGHTVKRTDVLNYFKPLAQGPQALKIDTDPIVLQKAARHALKLLSDKRSSSKTAIQPYIFNKKLVSIGKVKQTLRFIIALIENDKKKKRPFRILNPKFLNKYFKFIRWIGDLDAAKKNGKRLVKGGVYLTHYATFELDGSNKKTKKYPYALYETINRYFERDLRFKISKQTVLRGILNRPEYKNKVRPLVWVSREGLEEALMQGTAIIKLPGGRKRFFSVDKNNGFAYDKAIKDRRNQKRYWYFKEVKKNQYFRNRDIVNLGKTVFAGDIYNIGLGKIIAIRFRNRVTRKIEMRLGVLADSGGAFTNNLYQLDFYGGIFKNKKQFYNWVRPMPRNVQTYIVVKK